MLYNGLLLDPFQEQACRAIEQGNSVIVAAPTGAGKTVIAEYATDRCRALGRRIIYTAPIKALSNQKYRDFTAKYGDDVGIVTGDVVIDSTAPVIVMTTEIFRNTIFDDASRLGDVEYVIFDEIHYINDTERGTVWEESIIFAPQTIKFVCLSATIPNLREFADWIQSVRDVDLDVVSETERPVPLEHQIYMPSFGVASLPQFQRVHEELAHRRNEDIDAVQPVDMASWDIERSSMVDHLVTHKRLPCLYFCFSRRGCEERARFFAGARSFLTKAQEVAILDAFDETCRRFDIGDDPGATEFRALIQRGVAYHHAGMLPTLKEVVERLFTLGLIQLLFTTETFAVGINMPARSVVFDSLEKYDGIAFRYLKAREYQQMAGRAGRRGIDDVGYVYATVDPATAHLGQVEHVLTGEPEPIESQFNLSYSSILNLLDEHGERMFDICRQSFGNYQSYQLIGQLRRRVRDLERERSKMQEPQCIHPRSDAMERLTEYRNLSLDVQKRLEDLKPLRRDVKRRYSGRKKKRDRFKRLARIDNQAEMIKRELTQSACHGCEQYRTCQERYIGLEKRRTKLADFHAQIERAENYQRVQIDNRLKLLTHLGYVDGTQILPRGYVARQVYGYELQITELVFSGHFENLDPDEINALVVAIVFEAKKDEWYRRLDGSHVRGLVRAAAQQIEDLRALETTYGIDPPTQSMDAKLTSAALAWSGGCRFDELRQHTSTPDGDLVRVFRAAADLLRQMRRALKEHPTMPGLLLTSIHRLNRDIVDAERQLRADLVTPDAAEVA